MLFLINLNKVEEKLMEYIYENVLRITISKENLYSGNGELNTI